MMNNSVYVELATEIDRLTAESKHPFPDVAKNVLNQREGLALAMAIVYPQKSKYKHIEQSERRWRTGKSYFMGENDD